MGQLVPSDIYEQLTRDEAVRLHVYPDSRGFDTIGIGHNLDANPLPFDVSNGITLAQAVQILHDDVAVIDAHLLAALPWVVQLDDARHGVLLNMAFNMGVPGELKFHHELSDTQAGNYEQAALDMKASLWYTQVGARAQRLCEQMRTGVWQ
jgi:lysozyme